MSCFSYRRNYVAFSRPLPVLIIRHKNAALPLGVAVSFSFGWRRIRASVSMASFSSPDGISSSPPDKAQLYNALKSETPNCARRSGLSLKKHGVTSTVCLYVLIKSAYRCYVDNVSHSSCVSKQRPWGGGALAVFPRMLFLLPYQSICIFGINKHQGSAIGEYLGTQPAPPYVSADMEII